MPEVTHSLPAFGTLDGDDLGVVDEAVDILPGKPCRWPGLAFKSRRKTLAPVRPEVPQHSLGHPDLAIRPLGLLV